METDSKYFNKANLIATIAGIAISAFITMLIYVLTLKEPELTFYVNPEKSIVAQPIDESGLQILHKGEIVKEKIVLTQVSFWNAGKKSVSGKPFKENGDIIDGFQIYIQPNAKIIDVRISKISRDGINFAIDQNQLDDGIVPIKWDVLGKGDGVKLQLAYLDKENVEIKIRGSILDQDTIKVFIYDSNLSYLNNNLPLVVVGAIVFFSLSVLINNFANYMTNRIYNVAKNYILLSLTLMILVTLTECYIVYAYIKSNVPFGF